MAMKAKKPSTSNTMTKPMRVIPDCLDFMVVSCRRGGSPVQDGECVRGAIRAPQRRLPCPAASATPGGVMEATVRSMDDLAHLGEVEPAIARATPRQPDEERLADQVLFRHAAPPAAVRAVHPVVAHYDVAALGDLGRHGRVRNVQRHVEGRRKRDRVVDAAQVLGVQLRAEGHQQAVFGAVHAALERTDLVRAHTLAIDVQLAATGLDAVARQADDTLDPVLAGYRGMRILAGHVAAADGLAGFVLAHKTGEAED